MESLEEKPMLRYMIGIPTMLLAVLTTLLGLVATVMTTLAAAWLGFKALPLWTHLRSGDLSLFAPEYLVPFMLLFGCGVLIAFTVVAYLALHAAVPGMRLFQYSLEWFRAEEVPAWGFGRPLLRPSLRGAV